MEHILTLLYVDHARLKDHVAGMDGGLEAKINEGGKFLKIVFFSFCPFSILLAACPFLLFALGVSRCGIIVFPQVTLELLFGWYRVLQGWLWGNVGCVTRTCRYDCPSLFDKPLH